MAKQKNLRALARQTAARYGIPESIFFNLIQHESSWTPNAVSSAGAIGLTQLMPGTARGLKVNPWNPAENMDGGARYLRDQYKAFGKWDLALAAYGWGPGAVKDAGGVPAAARGYVSYVLKGFQGGGLGSGTMGNKPSRSGTGPILPGSAALGGIGPPSYSGPSDISATFAPGPFMGPEISGKGLNAAIASLTPPAPPAPPAGVTGGFSPPVTSGKYVKGEILLPTHFKSTHDTDGIDGYQASIDITAVNGKAVKPYMPVGAPEEGIIYRHGSAQGGDSLYFRGRSGRKYWIGHITRVLAVGSKVAKGGVIAYVADQHVSIPHVHIGILSG